MYVGESMKYDNMVNSLSDQLITSLMIQYQPITLKDRSSTRDILKLCQPYDATEDITALFSNQAVVLNKVVLAKKEADGKAESRLSTYLSTQLPLSDNPLPIS